MTKSDLSQELVLWQKKHRELTHSKRLRMAFFCCNNKKKVIRYVSIL